MKKIKPIFKLIDMFPIICLEKSAEQLHNHRFKLDHNLTIVGYCNLKSKDKELDQEVSFIYYVKTGTIELFCFDFVFQNREDLQTLELFAELNTQSDNAQDEYNERVRREGHLYMIFDAARNRSQSESLELIIRRSIEVNLRSEKNIENLVIKYFWKGEDPTILK